MGQLNSIKSLGVRLMPKPITGGWRVLIGAALAGTVFLVVKPNLKSEQLLMWSLGCGALGASVAWGLELYKPLERVNNEEGTYYPVISSNQLPLAGEFPSKQKSLPETVEVIFSKEFIKAIEKVGSPHPQQLQLQPYRETYSEIAQPTEIVEFRQEAQEVLEPSTQAENILEDNVILPAFDERSEGKTNGKRADVIGTELDDVWASKSV